MSVAIFPFRQAIGGHRPPLQKTLLDFDAAFEGKLGRSGQGHIREALTVATKINAEFTAAAHQHADRSVSFFGRRKDQRTCHYSGPASKRFVFHPALKSSNCDFVSAASFQEVHVRPLGRKHLVSPDGWTFS